MKYTSVHNIRKCLRRIGSRRELLESFDSDISEAAGASKACKRRERRKENVKIDTRRRGSEGARNGDAEHSWGENTIGFRQMFRYIRDLKGQRLTIHIYIDGNDIAMWT